MQLVDLMSNSAKGFAAAVALQHRCPHSHGHLLLLKLSLSMTFDMTYDLLLVAIKYKLKIAIFVSLVVFEGMLPPN